MSTLQRIVQACGGRLMDGGRRALIPGPGHSERDLSVSLAETEDGRILIHCFSPKDDWRTVRDALTQQGLLDGAERGNTAQVERAPLSSATLNSARILRAQDLWRAATALKGTPAGFYLTSRSIVPTASPCALGFLANARSIDDRKRRPALIGAIRDLNGVLQGVQLTLLAPGGKGKADVETPRRIVGVMRSGAVQLHAAGEDLIVAEGVETALSASHALGKPAWAALSAINLMHFTPPDTVKRLIIAADSDGAGATAAADLHKRLKAKLRVETALAPDGCNDWNDWAMQQGAV